MRYVEFSTFHWLAGRQAGSHSHFSSKRADLDFATAGDQSYNSGRQGVKKKECPKTEVSDKSLNKGLISEDRNARLLCFLQYPVLVQVVCMGFISGGKRF